MLSTKANYRNIPERTFSTRYSKILPRTEHILSKHNSRLTTTTTINTWNNVVKTLRQNSVLWKVIRTLITIMAYLGGDLFFPSNTSTIKTICPAPVKSWLLRKLRQEDSSGVSGQQGPQSETPSPERKRRKEDWFLNFGPLEHLFIPNTPKIILNYPYTFERCHLYRTAQDLSIFLDKETWIKSTLRASETEALRDLEMSLDIPWSNSTTQRILNP